METTFQYALIMQARNIYYQCKSHVYLKRLNYLNIENIPEFVSIIIYFECWWLLLFILHDMSTIILRSLTRMMIWLSTKLLNWLQIVGNHLLPHSSSQPGEWESSDKRHVDTSFIQVIHLQAYASKVTSLEDLGAATWISFRSPSEILQKSFRSPMQVLQKSSTVVASVTDRHTNIWTSRAVVATKKVFIACVWFIFNNAQSSLNSEWFEFFEVVEVIEVEIRNPNIVQETDVNIHTCLFCLIKLYSEQINF